MARRRSGELEFGSDSFLDIIANIVGILIILIVVAGLRASRSATVVESFSREPKGSAAPVAATRSPALRFESRLNPKVVRAPRPKVPPQPLATTPLPPIPVALPKADASLPKHIAAATKEVDDLRDLQRQFQLQLLAAQTERKSVEQALKIAGAGANASQSQRKAIAATLSGWRDDVAKRKQQLLALQRQYDEAKRGGTKAKQIVHKLTAVGKSVSGNEIHFRVAGGRVARVPLKKLVEEMKKDVGRRKSWLMKFPLHRGVVGPIDGFKMNYVIRRETTSLTDELRTGYGQVKLKLAGWRILPASTLEGETEQLALRTGSEFHRHLQFAETGTTLTFWVYPDSFGFYRKLLHASRVAGFQVAARPLPFGMPIAGSPRGTRSSGQ